MKDLFRAVFIPLHLFSRRSCARGEFPIQQLLGQSVVVHPDDMTYPAKSTTMQQTLK